ncbi:MAG: OmpP1/FadL family transporter [Candidatus Saccharicenans sp.]
MRKLMMVSLVLILGIVSSAFGSGFLIYEHGAAAMGMAGAFVSIANNPTAIFYNPAGIAWLKGTQVNAGGTFIFPSGSVSLPNWPSPTFSKVYQLDQTFFPPQFYFTHKFGSRVAAGIGVFAPYGLGTSWPVNYPLKYICTQTSMETLFINPAVAFMITDNLSIGVGVSYIHSTLSLDLVRNVVIPNTWTGDVPASLNKAKGNAVGYNAGLLFKKDKFSVGFHWRSGFNIDYSGTLTLDKSNVPSPLQPYIPSSGAVTTTFKFPNLFALGVAYQISDKLLWSAEAQYYTWKVYKNYTINIAYAGGGSEQELVEENFKNSIILRTGIQYQLKESWAVRCGILYDQTPQPVESMDPSLPDASRVALTVGLGYTKNKFRVDLGYQYEMFSNRTSPNRNIYPAGLGEGTYQTLGQLLGFTLGYSF